MQSLKQRKKQWTCLDLQTKLNYLINTKRQKDVRYGPHPLVFFYLPYFKDSAKSIDA